MATIGQVLADARAKLSEISETPQLEARLLLSEIIQQSTTWIFSHQDEVLAPKHAQQFASIIARRVTGYPVAYILGKRGFYHWDFKVTSDVLIPRPETELLVEKAVEWVKKHKPEQKLNIVDVGTGSGIIAISLAKLLPDAKVFAVDISAKALAVAQENAVQLDTSNIHFLQGSLLEVFDLHPHFDLITANLPYIPTNELKMLDVSHWEPHLALDGGGDGLLLIQRLLQQSKHRLKASGCIFLEIGADQSFAVVELGYTMFPSAVIEVHQDLAGFERVVIIENWETNI